MVIDNIADVVCKYYAIDKSLLFKKYKGGNVVKAKQLVAYFGKAVCKMSFPEIGHYFGKHEHTTVRSRYYTIKHCIECQDYLYDDYINLYAEVCRVANNAYVLVMLKVSHREDLHSVLKSLSGYDVEIEVANELPKAEPIRELRPQPIITLSEHEKLIAKYAS